MAMSTLRIRKTKIQKAARRALEIQELRRQVFGIVDRGMARERRKRRLALAVRGFEIAFAAAVIALVVTAGLRGCA